MDFSSIEGWLRKDGEEYSPIEEASLELEFNGRIEVEELQTFINDYLPNEGERLSTERVSEGSDRLKLVVKERDSWVAEIRDAMKELKMQLCTPKDEDPFLVDLEIRKPMSVVNQTGERNWNITGWKIQLLRQEPGNINSPMISFQDTIQWELREVQANGRMKTLATVNSLQKWKPYKKEIAPNEAEGE